MLLRNGVHGRVDGAPPLGDGGLGTLPEGLEIMALLHPHGEIRLPLLLLLGDLVGKVDDVRVGENEQLHTPLGQGLHVEHLVESVASQLVIEEHRVLEGGWHHQEGFILLRRDDWIWAGS